MPPIARRNLFHDKVRLAVTITGITFAVVLMVVELGLFLGFSMTTTSLIDHSGADCGRPPAIFHTLSRASLSANENSTRFVPLLA